MITQHRAGVHNAKSVRKTKKKIKKCYGIPCFGEKMSADERQFSPGRANSKLLFRAVPDH